MADDGFGFGSAAPIADDDDASPTPIDVPPASQARAELLHAPVPRRRAFLARLTPAALAYYNLTDALTLLGVLTRVPETEPVGRALVAADEARAPEDRLGVLEHAVHWLAHEARKASAPGDALVLLGWVCTLWDLVLARGACAIRLGIARSLMFPFLIMYRYHTDLQSPSPYAPHYCRCPSLHCARQRQAGR